ncbi:hypothetical protein NW762_001344 [Fusarium torreyae]|uniref:Uncharacterized protein n=1 Tax=Fusarium torreyae TaxID=1237075 RepID=A0A9W8VL56_9HYPO|nr:hypothetical protein NW762_001344 [Fusarium torreyae]
MLKPIRIKHQVSKYPQVDYNQQDSITLDDGSQLKVSDSPEPCPTTGPTQARPLIYESLGQLEISYWTDVPISNDVAAQAISLYMEIDYPVLPLFHADLFIQDLIQQRNIASLTADLFVEAEKAFSEISSYINTLTTVSGLQLMCMTAVTQGRDDVAIKYLETGVKVGVMMGLFGIQPNSPSANSWLEGYQDWQIAASYTAWGVYNWVAIYYHAIVTDVFRPFLAETSRPLHLSTFSVPGATPEAAYRASVNQLKRLLLIYRLNFEAGMLSVVWQTGLIYVANAVMREVKTSSNEWRYYLNLCMAGLEDLYVSFRVFGSIAKAMLSIALEHGALEAAESRRIKDELEELGRHHAVTRRLGDGREVATWIIDLDLAITDPEAARGSELAERFQALILEDGSEEDSKNSEHDNIQDSSF